MAIRGARQGTPGREQHLGVDVGAQAGEGRLGAEADDTRGLTGLAHGGRGAGDGGVLATMESAIESFGGEEMKVLKPLPHGVIDYAMAGTLMAAPWLFGFSRNKKATANAVTSGAAILGLSLMTRYPLGAVKMVPFPVHGVIETVAGVMTAAAPWLMGFSRNRSAKLTHVLSGLGTLAVVAMTDYRAAEAGGGAGATGGLGSGARGEMGSGAGGTSPSAGGGPDAAGAGGESARGAGASR